MYNRDKVIELLETMTVLTPDEYRFDLSELLRVGDRCAEVSGVSFAKSYERRYGLD